MQAVFDDFLKQTAAHDLKMNILPMDPPEVKQGIFGQPHDYEGGFKLVTITRQLREGCTASELFKHC